MALRVVREVDDSAAIGIVLAGDPLVGFASAVGAAELLVRGLRACRWSGRSWTAWAEAWTSAAGRVSLRE